MKITKNYSNAWEDIFEEGIKGTVHIVLKDDTIITAELDGDTVWGEDCNDIYLSKVIFNSKVLDVNYPVGMYISCDQIAYIIFTENCESDTDRGLM